MATEWSFPVEDLPDDPRRELPLFVVPPNWKNGVTETLAWLTDVMSSETAVEQRRSLRRYPRRTFEYEFLRAGMGRARIENFLAGVGKRDCLVPIWHEQFTLATTPTDDGLIEFPNDSLVEREFDLDDLVLVINSDFNKFGVLTIVEIDKPNDTITLNGIEDVGTWPRGSRIVPLRRAKMLDSVTLENASDRVGVTRMRFTLQDADDRFPASWGLCAPLWRFKPDRQGGLSTEFNRSDYVLDFNTGVIDVTDPGDRAQISQSMSLKFFSRSALWAYRSFLYNARGRARRFYVPTYTSDLELLADSSGGDELEVKANGFSEYFLSPQDARRIVSIEYVDGRPSVYRKIIGASAVISTSAPFLPVAEQLTLDQSLPPILQREVERISFLVPSRFDQDTIEIFHAVAGSYAAASAVVMRSCSLENMPPLECWVTSRPYPIVAIELIETGATITGGQLYDGQFEALEEIASVWSVTAGTLETVISFGNFAAPPEEVQTDVMFTDGTIDTILVVVEVAPEEMKTDSNIISGTIKKILITYQMQPEALDLSANITGGTLV